METKKVLFPVDLAGSSYRIVPQVRSIADQFDAELHIVNVVESLGGYSTFFIPHQSLELMEPEIMALAKRHLEEFVEKYFEDRPKVETVVLRGNPVEQIRKYIESAGIDMVVVASIDPHGLERAIFGDIAKEIIRTSPVPVTTVNPFVAESARVQRPEIHPMA
ncbi:MAG: universal stress protein [Syntrophobacteraceae bacterium]